MTIPVLLLSLCLGSQASGPASARRSAQASTPAPAQAPRTSTPATTPAQTPRSATPAPAAEKPAPSPGSTRREGQPVNVKVDVTITDTRGGTAAAKKTVSVVTADNMGGFIRSQASYFNIGDVPLNVDTEPFLLPDGKIRLRVNLQYELPAPPPNPNATTPAEVGREAGGLRKTSIHESLSLVLESGKALIAAQSADPVGDRQVTIEVKATVLR